MKDEKPNDTLELIEPVLKKPSPSLNTYTIENANGTRLVVSNIGAAVLSFFVKDRSGIHSDIVLGYDNLADYLRDEVYMGTVVGRNANRIGGARVLIEGRSYKISIKNGGYHHHGGVTGFNKKIFSAEPFRQGDLSGIVFRYTSPHLEEGFPGELSLEVTYTLDIEDAWTIEYRAVSTRTTLLNLTQHTYFNLSGDPSKSIEEHELKILSQHYLPVNKLQLPTGELAMLTDTPFDFSRFKKIATDITQNNEQLKLSRGYDHSFVLKTKTSSVLKHAAVVKEAQSGRRMDVYTTEPCIHFYTGNFLDNIKGKGGMIYRQRAGFCLETQHFPDAPNHPHFPSTILQAGKRFYSKTVFKLSLID